MDGSDAQFWAVLLAGLIGALGAIGAQFAAGRQQAAQTKVINDRSTEALEAERDRWSKERATTRSVRHLDRTCFLYDQYLTAAGSAVDLITTTLGPSGHGVDRGRARMPTDAEIATARAVAEKFAPAPPAMALYAPEPVMAAADDLRLQFAQLQAALAAVRIDQDRPDQLLDAACRDVRSSFNAVVAKMKKDVER